MQFEIGMVFEGKVSGITKYGVFVDLPDNKTGMVHISEVSSDYVKEIRDYVKEGQTVKVKFIGVNDKGKISLSMRQAQDGKSENFKKKQNRTRQRYERKPAKPVTTLNDDGYFEGNKNQAPMNFEEMMSKFKQTSDERISDLKKSTESKRGRFPKKNTNQR